MTRIYIAGPMSGLPDFNFPAFHAAAAKLRALGFDVENPADYQHALPSLGVRGTQPREYAAGRVRAGGSSASTD